MDQYGEADHKERLKKLKIVEDRPRENPQIV